METSTVSAEEGHDIVLTRNIFGLGRRGKFFAKERSESSLFKYTNVVHDSNVLQ